MGFVSLTRVPRGGKDGLDFVLLEFHLLLLVSFIYILLYNSLRRHSFVHQVKAGSQKEFSYGVVSPSRQNGCHCWFALPTEKVIAAVCFKSPAVP